MSCVSINSSKQVCLAVTRASSIMADSVLQQHWHDWRSHEPSIVRKTTHTETVCNQSAGSSSPNPVPPVVWEYEHADVDVRSTKFKHFYKFLPQSYDTLTPGIEGLRPSLTLFEVESIRQQICLKMNKNVPSPNIITKKGSAHAKWYLKYCDPDELLEKIKRYRLMTVPLEHEPPYVRRHFPGEVHPPKLYLCGTAAITMGSVPGMGYMDGGVYVIPVPYKL